MDIIGYSDHRSGFIKQSRGQAVDQLLKHPNEFVLLTQIARRARWHKGLITFDNLAIGEALIGDFESLGISEREYRTAKKRLAKAGLATFRATSRGTIAKLIGTDIYDINIHRNDEQNDEQTPCIRQTNDREETTNKEGEKNKKENKKRTKSSSVRACLRNADETFSDETIKRLFDAYPKKTGANATRTEASALRQALADIQTYEEDAETFLLDRISGYALHAAHEHPRFIKNLLNYCRDEHYTNVFPNRWTKHA